MLAAFMDAMGEPAAAVTDHSDAMTEPTPPSFEAFFEAERSRLLRALFLMTGNVQEAEELMQDAFLAVWERWDRVGMMEDPTGYLYRTAMNRYRSARRRLGRATRRLVGAAEGGDAFASADERDAVARALAALPRRQRQAVVLTELYDYDSDEAGRLLGVKAVTVRVLASQGRASMRLVLEEDDA